MSNAAFVPRSDLFDTGDGAGNDLIKPTSATRDRCDERGAGLGANWAAWGTVQKVSNLILNINVYMEDAESGKMKFARSVDIRGNTDESWRRGLDYLLRNYLLREP